jgi:cell wall-associated NlpC family hydrolase
MILSDKLSHFIQLSSLASILVLTGCASVPETKPTPQTQSKPSAVTYALSLQGTPYVYGQSSPKKGFDCSGFVKHVYETQGVNLPRSSYDMALTLPKVAKNDVHSGDLVFFDVNGKAFSHVGIYVDHDKFIHAPSHKTGKVLVSSLKNTYWQQRYTGVRRPKHPY